MEFFLDKPQTNFDPEPFNVANMTYLGNTTVRYKML